MLLSCPCEKIGVARPRKSIVKGYHKTHPIERNLFTINIKVCICVKKILIVYAILTAMWVLIPRGRRIN
jgi:hypothetical protein